MYSTQTHTFDGHWEQVIGYITSHPRWPEALEICRRKLVGRELINAVPQLSALDADLAVCDLGQTALPYFYMILSGDGNYDTQNQIDAFPILVFLSLFPRDKDMTQNIAEQLCDMGTGSCPQGRTTRLAQIADSFI